MVTAIRTSYSVMIFQKAFNFSREKTALAKQMEGMATQLISVENRSYLL